MQRRKSRRFVNVLQILPGQQPWQSAMLTILQMYLELGFGQIATTEDWEERGFTEDFSRLWSLLHILSTLKTYLTFFQIVTLPPFRMWLKNLALMYYILTGGLCLKVSPVPCPPHFQNKSISRRMQMLGQTWGSYVVTVLRRLRQEENAF